MRIRIRPTTIKVATIGGLIVGTIIGGGAIGDRLLADYLAEESKGSIEHVKESAPLIEEIPPPASITKTPVNPGRWFMNMRYTPVGSEAVIERPCDALREPCLDFGDRKGCEDEMTALLRHANGVSRLGAYAKARNSVNEYHAPIWASWCELEGHSVAEALLLK